MDGPPLDSKELEAIREAMQVASDAPPRPSDDIDPDDVSPLALIAEDRAAVTARPEGSKLGQRWARELRHTLRHLLSDDTAFEVVSSDVVDGPTLRDDLTAMWTAMVAPRGRRGHALIAVGGSVVEGLVARRLGDTGTVAESNRAPSRAALRLFDPLGRAVVTALVRAWRDAQACEVEPLTDADRAEAAGRALTDCELLVAVTLSVKGAVSGRLLIVARPETLVPPPAPVDAVPAPPGAIEDALGAVPVELRVDLGSAKMTRRQLAALHVGAVIELGSFVDDLLPVECGGVVKAYGRAVVHRGVLAVEIADTAARRNAA